MADGSLLITVVSESQRAAAQPSAAADALQPTLRSGFRAQRSAGVDMTSDVKGREQLFFRSSWCFFPPCIGSGGASKKRRLILLISVGWVPPSVRPSSACLTLGTSLLYKPHNAAEGYTTPGLRLFRCTLEPFRVQRFTAMHATKSRLCLTRRWAPPWQWSTESLSAHGQWPR
jgi:hypothetical protein